jgi:hypothetical protein
MRRPVVAGCWVLALACVAARSEPEAQIDETLPPSLVVLPTVPQAAKTDAKPAAGRSGASETDDLGQCLHDWDRATHMTRQEWARTCRRVAANRIKFLREQSGQ